MEGPLRVMLLDDDVAYLGSVKELLTTPDCKVHICDKPSEALAMIKTVKPHCLILDLNMPFLNGDDILPWARKENPQMPIIICSGNEVVKDRLFKAYGVKHILKKPVSSAMLIQTIKTAVEESNQA